MRQQLAAHYCGARGVGLRWVRPTLTHPAPLPLPAHPAPLPTPHTPCPLAHTSCPPAYPRDPLPTLRYITSDCDADANVYNSHHYTKTPEEAVRDTEPTQTTYTDAPLQPYA